MDTFKRSRTSKTITTAIGEPQTNEEAQVYVHDLHIFVTVQLLEETLIVLSVGKLCKEHGYTYEWPSGREPRLKWESDLLKNQEFRPIGSSKTIIKFYHSFLLDIASARSIHFLGPSNHVQQRNCNEGIPEWLDDFTENLEIAEIPTAANISHDTDLETSYKSGITEAQYF